MLPHSIRWRFQIWLGFLLVCLLCGFGITAYELHRTNQFNHLDQELDRRVSALSGAMRANLMVSPRFVRPPLERNRSPSEKEHTPSDQGGRNNAEPKDGPRAWGGGRMLRLSQAAQNMFDETDPNSFYYVVWSGDGLVMAATSNAPPVVPLPSLSSPERETVHRMRGLYRESFYFNGVGQCALAGCSVASELSALRHFGWWLVAGGAAVLLLGLGGGCWLVSRALQPVEDISAAAMRISAGNLSERITVAEKDGELGRLAGVLNSTFARLDAAFAQQKQFTADASHELRTPLAVIITEAQATLARERTPGEYCETIKACHDTAQQMRQLTNSLLQLARFDAGQERMERAAVRLDELAKASIDLVRPLAAERNIAIQCDLKPATVQGDSDRLQQVITNLLSNAIYYNKTDGMIQVRTDTEGGKVMLSVSDSGIGITEADLPRIFERFFRVDKARSQAGGHNGLGLAICKAIVESHGGTINATSEPGKGSVFTVHLPNAAGHGTS